MGFNFNTFLSRTSLYIALAAAWTALLGSLYFSEVKGYLPCDLCWYQRILMYPLTVILAVGLLRQDINLPYFVLPLSVIGQGVSTYHYLLEKTTLFAAPAACRSSVPCTIPWINWFGFITIAFLAMMAFFIITIMMLVAVTSGEPDESANRPSPWFQVVGIMAAILIAFAALYFTTEEPAQAFTPVEVAAGEMTPAGEADATPASPAVLPTLAAPPPAPPELAEGQRLYLEACAVCHGMDARGMPNLGGSLVDSESIDTQTDVEVITLIRAGVDVNDPINQTGVPMPPSGGRPDLTNEQLIEILRYLRAQ